MAGYITDAQRCRAEFYAQGIGWIPADPAEVRKVILEPNRNLTLAGRRRGQGGEGDALGRLGGELWLD